MELQSSNYEKVPKFEENHPSPYQKADRLYCAIEILVCERSLFHLSS